MNEPLDDSLDGTSVEKTDGLAELRELLLFEERARLKELERDSLDAGDLSHVLPEAILLRGADDEQLANALAPTLERGIERSARRNPKILADAIFPVIGPAIRKSIQAALATAIESINVTIERSFSIRSLRWRWEARRTGKPYAEIVFLHSILYRVEQVFLIHQESGILLATAVADHSAAKDADMVAGMLTAITDFIGDSFMTSADDGTLQRITVADAQVLIVQGPHAVLAAVVRGNPPSGLRTELERVIERVHLDHSDHLATFAGDEAPFRASIPLLEGLLEEQVQPSMRPRRMGAVVPAILVLVTILLTVQAFSWQRARRSWSAAIDLLRDEPGYVVLEAHRGDREVRGLKDPDARALPVVLQGTGLAESDLTLAWEPYHSLDPALVIARAEAALDPPPRVRLGLEGERLLARGVAGADWIRRARALAPGLAGVAVLDTSELVDDDRSRFESKLASLRDRELRFGPAIDLGADQVEVVALLQDLEDIDHLASEVRVLLHLDLVGFPASGEPPELGLRRAEALRDQVHAAQFSCILVGTPRFAVEPASQGGVRLTASCLGDLPDRSR